MNVNRKWWRSLLVVSVVTMLVLAACGGSGESPSEETDGGDGDGGGAVEGEIVAIGSSTVEPIMSIALEDFAAANEGAVTFEVDGPGTGDGFAIFCEDGSDIANASRPIDEEEVALCEEAGIEYVELKIGIDGLSVITSPDNADVTCLSFGDLYALMGPESQGFANWSDANDLAAEVGADFGELHAPYPEASLDITAPGEESGTYGSFIEIALGDIAEARLEAGAITEDQVETLQPGLPGVGRRQRDHREHRRLAELAGLRRVRVRGPERRLGEDPRGRRWRRLRRAHARDDRQQRVPDLA